MGRTAAVTARMVRAFVNSPVTNLVKGLALLTIGLSDAWGTARQDIARGHLRVGHGLIIIGLFSLLEALPHLIEGLDAGGRFLEGREVDEILRTASKEISSGKTGGLVEQGFGAIASAPSTFSPQNPYLGSRLGQSFPCRCVKIF